MAGQLNRRTSINVSARHRRVAGLGAAASAVVAVVTSQLAAAPPVKADVVDSIIDPITAPLQATMSGVTDALAGVDPTTGLDVAAGVDFSAGWDVSTLFDPSSIDFGAAASAASSSDAAASAASSSDAASAWFERFVYLPLHCEMENWINSHLGERLDGFINQPLACISSATESTEL